VSRRSWASLAGQAVDAVAFLQKHRRIDRKTIFAQFGYFPPKLVSLAGALGCGLELSIYPRKRPNPGRRKRPAR
jgi:hypothetical protein